MRHQDLLFEIGTEELPPKALKHLSESLSASVAKALDQEKLAYKSIQSYSTPRRLAFVVSALQEQQADEKVERLGPAIAAAYNEEDGTPTQAALGFAKSCGVAIESLAIAETPKGNRLAYSFEKKGMAVSELLPEIIAKALKTLPVPKMMRWGSADTQFARPVHWVVLMYGEDIIPAKILGKESGNITRGHRFHSEGDITLKSATDYAVQLKSEGSVIVDAVERQAMIVSQAEMAAKKYLAEVVMDKGLLEEVTALVEYPQALCCEFPKDYLRVPQEALISSMQSHQKCFPLLNSGGKLINHFITISNIKSLNTTMIVEGNMKVMNARLADAAFFYDTDLKKPFAEFLKRLDSVTFQQKLGTLTDKSKRVAALAGNIAEMMGVSKEDAMRAGELSKADLMSDMVNEFPELQGIMGGYYAEASEALSEQYLPRFSGDRLPKEPISQALALAEKLDTLVGIFGIGMKPTGDKDPFALRRAAIGVIRILKEGKISLSITEMLAAAIAVYRDGKLLPETSDEVLHFMIERLKNIYREEGVNISVFDSVAAVEHSSLLDFNKRIAAVCHFSSLPESESLAAANKRVTNLLEKNNIVEALVIDTSLLRDSAEINLYDAIESSEHEIVALSKEEDYQEILSKLAVLEKPVNHFFDHVMIMDEDLTLRRNRLAVLQKLQALFKQVADISKLAV